MEPNEVIVRHWILNLAVEGARMLSDFVPSVEELHLNLQAVPGATPYDYGEAFLTLYDAGHINCFRDAEAEYSQTKANRSVVESVIQARLQIPHVTSRRSRIPGPVGQVRPDLRWELSTSGGEEWERFAQPDWERYVFALFGPQPSEESQMEGDAWSASLDSLMIQIGWCNEFNNLEIDRQSIELEILHNHPITYWKVIPVVYHATFLCRSTKIRTKPEWFRDWWLSRRKWYKEPWSLSIWPTP